MRRIILSLTMLIIVKEIKIEQKILSNHKTQEEIMNLSNNFTKMVEQHEGFSAVAYKDANGYQTIGYGTMIDSAQLDYLKQATITPQEGEQLLFYNAATVKYTLNNLIAHGLKVNQNQFDALADFCYNCGVNALLQSTLLKRIQANPDNLEEIKRCFLMWDKIVSQDASGNKMTVTLPGLATRRLDEFTLYSTPIQDDTQTEQANS